MRSIHICRVILHGGVFGELDNAHNEALHLTAL